MYRNVIFDLDGTLVDSLPGVLRAFLQGFEEMGIEMDMEMMQINFREATPLENTLSSFLPPDDVPAAVDRIIDIYLEVIAEGTELYPHVEDTLDRLTAEGVGLAIATGKKIQTARRTLEVVGLQDRFLMVMGRDLVERSKPAPDMVIRIVEDMNWSREETLFVGDTHNDILAGRDAGVRTCVATYGYGDPACVADAGPDHSIRSFKCLLDVVLDRDWMAQKH